MGAGSAAVSTSQKKEIGSGPPFALTSANNGVSVDAVTGKLVLGNALGTGAGGSSQLLNNREIQTNNFALTLQAPGGTISALLSSNHVTLKNTGTANTVDLTALAITFTDAAATSFIQPDRIDLRKAGNVATLIATAELDLFGTTATPPQIRFADSGGQINYLGQVVAEFMITSGGQPGTGARMLSLNQVTGIYQIGDINGTSGLTFLKLDDFAGQATLNSTQGLLFTNSISDPNRTVTISNSSFLLLDSGSGEEVGITPGQIFIQDGASNTSAMTPTLIKSGGPLQTPQPSANGSGQWLLGKRLAGAVALDTTQSIQVMIDGVLRKILIGV